MTSNELTKLSQAMAAAVAKAAESTVLVNARRRFPASGIALSKELVLTANHVVEVDEDIEVILPDGTQTTAELLGRDPGSDLALLKLTKGKAVPAQTNGDPQIGQLALALGRPTSEGIQASQGIVSAIGGPARTRRGGMLEAHIRTDAIPYPGFSGGPLVDAEGKVLGINTSGLGHGNSVAIPIKLAQKVADSLEKHGSVKRGYLGVRSQLVEIPEAAQKALGRDQAYGLLVVSLESDSPAAGGGLTVGDIIAGLNGEPTESHDELLALLTGDVVGQTIPVEVLRGGKPETLKIKIGERKDPPHRHGPQMAFRGAWGPGPWRHGRWRGSRHHERGRRSHREHDDD